MSDDLKINRRSFLIATAAVGAMGPPAFSKSTDWDRVVELLVDRVAQPIGLGLERPRFSWRLLSHRPGARQESYRIMVASDLAALAAGSPDLWDSGRVRSDRSNDLRYEGVALRSRQCCYWCVQVWNEEGQAVLVSEPCRFELGLLEASDWKAQWIAAENDESRGDRLAGLHWIWGRDPKPAATQKFRFPFEVAAPPIEAVLIIAARDTLHGVWLDGQVLSYEPFRKGPVDFWRMVTVKLPLTAGRHVLQAEASYVPGAAPESNGGALAAIVRLKFADGSVRRLTSGPDWLTATDVPANWRTAIGPASLWSPSVRAASIPPGFPYPAAPARQLRRSFRVNGAISKARLYITALGAYEPRLNGQKVGNALLAPESSDYTKRVLYRVYDLSDQIRQGENVLAATVADGWYASRALFSSRYPFGPPPRKLLAQLELTFADGRTEVIATDAGWKQADGPIRAATIYDGETYDARQEHQGWDSAGFNDTEWESSAPADVPKAVVSPEISPPIRVFRTWAPALITEVEPGVHVFDFGQNFAGWCRLRGKAPRGTKVVLRFAERLLASGRVDQSNLRSALGMSTYVFKGDPGGEEYEPAFTYFGFRYVELTGWPGELPSEVLEARAISSDLTITGSFRSSSSLLNQIWKNVFWSQRSNFMGIPTDCPQRDERLGWMGDAQVFWDTAAFNMDVDAFTHRFMNDVRDGQAADGPFADYNPQPAIGPMRGSPGWADAGILLPWITWWRYGDTAVIDENWRAMERYLQHILQKNPDFLWRNDRGIDYGDWLALDAKEPGDPTTPKDLVATAYWARTTRCMAEMAAATGRVAESEAYGRLASEIRRAFIATFVGPSGKVGNGSQTGYVLSLKFGLLPSHLRPAATEALAYDIRRRGGVLSTGFLGTPHALDVLADGGHLDLVAHLLERVDYPSWGYMVSKGATTMWERWNSDVGDVAMNSFNHYAFGSIASFFYRRLAGLDALEPGFKRILVNPLLIPDLSSVSATYHSAHGPISVDWSLSRNKDFLLDLRVPANTVATVHLSVRADGRITYRGRPFRPNRHTRIVKRASDFVVVECTSGDHRFGTELSGAE